MPSGRRHLMLFSNFRSVHLLGRFARHLSEIAEFSDLSRFLTHFAASRRLSLRGLAIRVLFTEHRLDASFCVVFTARQPARAEILLWQPNRIRPADLQLAMPATHKEFLGEETETVPAARRIPHAVLGKGSGVIRKLVEEIPQNGVKVVRWAVFRFTRFYRPMVFASAKEAFAFLIGRYLFLFAHFTSQAKRLGGSRGRAGLERLSWEFADRFFAEFQEFSRRSAKKVAA